MVRDVTTEEDWPAVGRAIDTRMRERRVSQQALAAASGVSVATLRELRLGTTGRRAQDSTLVAISRALDWPDDHLFVVLLGRTPRTLALAPPPIDRQILDVLLRIERQMAHIGARLSVPAAGGDHGQDQPGGHDDGPDPTAA